MTLPGIPAVHLSFSLNMVPLAFAAAYFVVAELWLVVSDRRDARAERGQR